MSWLVFIIIIGVVIASIVVVAVVVLAKPALLVPIATASFTVASVTTSTASLQWTAIPVITEYVLQYKLSSASSYVNVGTMITPQFTVDNLQPNTEYNFQVAGKNATGVGAFAQLTAQTGLPAPTGLLTPSCTTTTINLSWTAIPNAVEYKIYMRTDEQTSLSLLGNVNAPEVTYQATGLTINTLYHFAYAVRNSTATSATSASVSKFTLPGLIPQISIANITLSSMQLSWNSVPLAIGYKIQYKTLLSTTWTSEVDSEPNICIITGLDENTPYNFRGAVVNPGGTGAFGSSVAATTRSSLTPGDITGFAVASKALGQITFNWNQLVGTNTYHIEYKRADQSELDWKEGTGGVATVAGLTASTSYNFRIYASNNNGNGPYSSVLTTTSAPNAPGLVTGFVNTGFGYSKRIKLEWNAYPGAIDYSIQYRTVGGSFITVANLGGQFAYIRGLAVSTTYECRIAARNETALGPYTDPVVQASPNPTAPTPATEILYANDYYVWVRMYSNAGIDGYYIRYTGPGGYDENFVYPSEGQMEFSLNFQYWMWPGQYFIDIYPEVDGNHDIGGHVQHTYTLVNPPPYNPDG